MNRNYKKEKLKDSKLPFRLDSFTKNDDGYFFVEYDGWDFEAKTEKAVFNKVLKYVFDGGED